MKKVLSIISVIVLSAYIFGYVDTAAAEEPYKVTVNNTVINLDDLPSPPYEENGTLMVPLRKISEALGYSVSWDPDSGAITVDDEYIQKATLFDGTDAVVFDGRLKIINMSRKIENAAPTAVRNGHTYVPLSFFKEFFNDVSADNDVVTITPSKCELNISAEQSTDRIN